MCRDIRVREIESFIMYFLGIMGIIGFCNFIIFPSSRNTLMLKYCSICF